MPRPTVYIETTIPSYDQDSRPALLADIQRTRVWWDSERTQYECFTSQVVLDELGEGQYPNKENCTFMLGGIPMLALAAEVERIAAVYQARQLMPRLPVRDALHVAFASFYRLDFLLTWNCRHLANANKARHLRELNTEMGLHVPVLITPHQLQPWEDSR